MHMLPGENVEKLEGAPNFRQVAGFPIFGVGQPTEEGFFKVLEKTKAPLMPAANPEAPTDPAPVPAPAEGEAPVSDDPPRAIWFNMRKEPVIYVNGSPCAPRYPDDLHKNLEIQFSVEELEILQKHYLRHIQDISKDNSVNLHTVVLRDVLRDALEILQKHYL